MIQSNELRIGNLLQNEKEDRFFECTLEDLQIIQEGSTCKPIPLTEEWLIKFGFSQVYVTDPQEVDSESKYWINDFHIFSIPNKGIFFWKNDKRIKIMHVHQLQNLYWCLTQKELTL